MPTRIVQEGTSAMHARPAAAAPSQLVARWAGGRCAPQGTEHFDITANTTVLQTTVPIEKAQAFKMHCIRNRTTVREELRRLVDQVVSTQPAER